MGGYHSYSNAARGPLATIGRHSDGKRFGARLSRSSQRLYVQAPSPGVLTLRDLLGRTIMTHEIKRAGGGSESLPVGKTLPKGIFIATFKGASSVEHQIISGF